MRHLLVAKLFNIVERDKECRAAMRAIVTAWIDFESHIVHMDPAGDYVGRFPAGGTWYAVVIHGG